MYIDYKLEGKYVNLRSVTEDDAEFILDIRNNPQISKYLPPLNVTVEQQRQWITKQRADNDSYYFVLESLHGDKKGEVIGTISIYDIDGNHGESGRTCSLGDPFESIEAHILFFDFIFCKLNLDYTTGWVYEENKGVIAMNNSYGIEWVGNKVDSNGQPYRECVHKKNSYLERREKLLKKLRLI